MRRAILLGLIMLGCAHPSLKPLYEIDIDKLICRAGARQACPSHDHYCRKAVLKLCMTAKGWACKGESCIKINPCELETP